MIRVRRSSMSAIVLAALASPPALAQLGPELPTPAHQSAAEPLAAPADVETDGAPARAIDHDPRAESLIPLGSPAVSDVLPNLSPPDQPSAESDAEPASGSRFTDIARTVAALLFVIALILALAWGVRRLAQKQGGLGAKLGAGGKAPSGVLEVLGRYPVASKLSLVVLRFDRRVLLIAQGHGAGASMSTLCELTDPTDVASVLSRVSDHSGINAAFKEAIASAERDIDTAMTTPASAPWAPDVFAPRQITHSPEGDRVELLDDSAKPELSPLRRRLDALRDGGAA